MNEAVGTQALVAARRFRSSVCAPIDGREPARFRWSDFFDEIDHVRSPEPTELPFTTDDPEADTAAPNAWREGLPWVVGLASIGLLAVSLLGFWSTWFPRVTDEWAQGAPLVGRAAIARSFAPDTQLTLASLEEPSRLALFSAGDVPEPNPTTIVQLLDEDAAPSDQPSAQVAADETPATAAVIESSSPSPARQGAGDRRPDRKKIRTAKQRSASPQPVRVAAATEPKATAPENNQGTDASNPLVTLLFPLAPLFTPPQPPGTAYAP